MTDICSDLLRSRGVLPWPLTAALCLLAGAVCAAPAERWLPLQAELETLRQSNNVPAMGLVILDERQVAVIQAFGNWSTTTPFRWGSISKSFTALGALRLVEEDKLTLDARVRTLLPEGVFANPWPDTPLRVGHLLALSAGLTDLSGVEWDDNTPRPLSAALERRVRTLAWPPGLQHTYSNVPPGLTAAVIEAISQQDFNTYMQAAVLRPLGMNAASYEPVTGLPGGHKADGNSVIPYWHMTFPAFGALNASLQEMSHFLTMLLQHGQLHGRQVFASKTIERMFKPSPTLGAEAGLAVGYGSGIYGWVSNGHLFLGHGGDADGYRSRYGLLPGAGRGYLIAINTDNPKLLRRIQRIVEASLTAGRQKPTPPPTMKGLDLTPYTGEYYPADSRFDLATWQSGKAPRATLTAAGTQLLFERQGRQTVLLPVAPGQFRRRGDPAVTVVFAASADGNLYLQGELGNFVSTNQRNCPGFLAFCLK